MIVIETSELPPVSYKLTEGVPDLLNFDYLFVKSNHGRVLSSLLKGLFAALSMLAVAGFPICFHNQFVVGLVAAIAFAFGANELIDQKVSAERPVNVGNLSGLSFRSVNPCFAAIPVVFLFSTMDVQTLMLALSSTFEVLGIACGVPFMIYGIIKMAQDPNFGKVHAFAGSLSAFGGVAIAVVTNLIVANGFDASVFSATNYFSNSIATIYAPDVVLRLDK